jgi:hypothetical protein
MSQINEAQFKKYQWRNDIPESQLIEIDEVIAPVAEKLIEKLNKGETAISINTSSFFAEKHYHEMLEVFNKKGYDLFFDENKRILTLKVKEKFKIEKMNFFSIKRSLIGFGGEIVSVIINNFMILPLFGSIYLLYLSLGF